MKRNGVRKRKEAALRVLDISRDGVGSGRRIARFDNMGIESSESSRGHGSDLTWELDCERDKTKMCMQPVTKAEYYGEHAHVPWTLS